jgi:DNA-binding MarR family transcriptional regulator
LTAANIDRRPNPQPSAARAPRGHPPAMPFDALSASLGYAIKRAQIRTYALLFRFFDEDSLSPGRMTVLWMIASDPGVNQSTLAQRLSITRASMVKVIDTLEARGLVQRHAVEGDRRSYALAVTPEGVSEVQRHRELLLRFEKALAAGLSAAERRELFRLLEKVGSG